MSDTSSPKQPPEETISGTEEETRFAPKGSDTPQPEEQSSPASQKQPESSLDLITKQADQEEKGQEQEKQEDPEAVKKAKSDALFWNLCLGLVALIVIGAGYIVYEKFSQLPNPIKDTREALAAHQNLIREKQQQLKEIRNKTVPKEQLLSLLNIMENTANGLQETQKSIEKEKMRVAGIRGEIRSYYERYRQDARAKARGRKFDILKTTHSGKTYLNVEILRVENESVRIMHEQGSTSIPAGDLPDHIREILAYGDPLNITAMNQTDSLINEPLIRQAPAPAPRPVTQQPTKKKVVVTDPEPPAGKPKIETPTNTGTTSSTNSMWVPPAHSQLPPL